MKEGQNTAGGAPEDEAARIKALQDRFAKMQPRELMKVYLRTYRKNLTEAHNLLQTVLDDLSDQIENAPGHCAALENEIAVCRVYGAGTDKPSASMTIKGPLEDAVKNLLISLTFYTDAETAKQAPSGAREN